MELKIPEVEGKSEIASTNAMKRDRPMNEEILVCLDGSSFAETILPLARGIAAAKRATLTILRVVSDRDELASEERYMRERARFFGAQARFLVSPDPAVAILKELQENPRYIPAMTTRGRTGVMDALLGSVALQVIRGAGRPVLLYRPQTDTTNKPAKIGTIVTPLDGSEFSEKIVPAAVEMANSLQAQLMLVQALPIASRSYSASDQPKGDILESSYLQSKAVEIKNRYGIDPNWDVLHGEPSDAICRYVNGMLDPMLAMTTHARGGLQRTFLGSVASACLRRAGVPMFVYWPEQ